jgi:hypothetical protein
MAVSVEQFVLFFEGRRCSDGLVWIDYQSRISSRSCLLVLESYASSFVGTNCSPQHVKIVFSALFEVVAWMI